MGVFCLESEEVTPCEVYVMLGSKPCVESKGVCKVSMMFEENTCCCKGMPYIGSNSVCVIPICVL